MGRAARRDSADRRALRNLGKELVVGLEGLESIDEQLECGGTTALTVLLQPGEHTAQLEDLLQLLAREEQLFVAGRRRRDIDRGVDATLGDAPVEPQLHVASALELLEDDFVHLGTRLDERSCQDGEGSAFFDVASRTEELLGRIQRAGVDAAR